MQRAITQEIVDDLKQRLGAKLTIDKMLGLGQRAGRLISGDFAVKSAINRGKVKLLIIALDAAKRTQRELTGACRIQKYTRYNLWFERRTGEANWKITSFGGGFHR